MSVFIVDEDGMQAEGSSDTLVNFYQTAQCHMPEGSTLHFVSVYRHFLNGNSLTTNFPSMC